MDTLLTLEEQANFDRDAAKSVERLYRRKLKALVTKATNGDAKSSLKLMEEMGNRDWALRRLGYEIEDGGRLVKWRVRTEKEIQINMLTMRAASGDVEAAMELLEFMSSGD